MLRMLYHLYCTATKKSTKKMQSSRPAGDDGVCLHCRHNLSFKKPSVAMKDTN